MKLYLLRCDECGAEATSEKHAGPCLGCGEMRDVYLCVCGCGADLCIPCLDAMQKNGPVSRPHHWYVAAEVDAPNGYQSPGAEAAAEVKRLELVALSEVFSKSELASLYGAAKSMVTLIETGPDAVTRREEPLRSLVTATNKLVGAINLLAQEAA